MHICIFMCVSACARARACVCVCVHAFHTCMRVSVFLRAHVCIRRRARDAQALQELALAERLGERPHLRGGDEPAAHRARVRPRPPRDQGRTWGRTGRRHRKSPRIARTHTRVRVMDTPVHTARRLYPEADATQAGAPARAPATTARPHARLGAAPKYMCLNIDGCPCTLYIQLNGWREIHVHPIDTYLFGYTHSSTPVCTMGPYMMHAYKYIIDV